MRSQFGELSEALFPHPRLSNTRRWKTRRRASRAKAPGFIYARYGNPTVAMFEERMALLEGAEAARATASGMAAVTASIMASGARRRPCGGGPRAFRLMPLRDRGFAAALRRRDDARRWRRPRPVEARRCGPTPRSCFLESPTNPGLDVYDIEGDRRDRACRRRDLRRRQRVRHTAAADARSNSAPIASSIPRPSMSTDMGGASAAWCSAARRSSRLTCTITCARRGRLCRRSTPG